MHFIDGGITLVGGVRCSGVKEGKNGLGIIECHGNAAGLLTKNRIKAAPVIVTMENLKTGTIEGVIANSGNANAFTGEMGIKNARRMCEILAERLGCNWKKIAVASTGIIGEQLDIAWIESRIDIVFDSLGSNRAASLAFAESIMTTDRFPKEVAVEIGDAVIAGVAKGAGMIAPNMATMLSFIFTDADFESHDLKKMLSKAADRSFNVTVVDGDTSTNDMVLLVSTGQKKVSREKFQKGLSSACINLAKQIARDGEGATKFMEVIVEGARSDKEAFKAAKSVASSLLVKTALFGNDPNWGRIVAALGYSGCDVDEHISIALQADTRVGLVKQGEILDTCSEAKRLLEKNKELKILINLHNGKGKGYAFGCDLSYDYVRINAEYTT